MSVRQEKRFFKTLAELAQVAAMHPKIVAKDPVAAERGVAAAIEAGAEAARRVREQAMTETDLATALSSSRQAITGDAAPVWHRILDGIAAQSLAGHAPALASATTPGHIGFGGRSPRAPFLRKTAILALGAVLLGGAFTAIREGSNGSAVASDQTKLANGELLNDMVQRWLADQGHGTGTEKVDCRGPATLVAGTTTECFAYVNADGTPAFVTVRMRSAVEAPEYSIANLKAAPAQEAASIPAPAAPTTSHDEPQVEAAVLSCVVDTTPLNVRTGPGTEYEILTAIPVDDCTVADAKTDGVTSQSTNGGVWRFITWNGTSGWVSDRMLSPAP